MPIFFIVFLLFCLWVNFNVSKTDKDNEQARKEFLEREHKANFTRKQSTENLTRISCPDNLIFHADSDNESLISIENKIKDTFSHEIINLTGISNTDLKLTYGRANLDYLSECDYYYTRLVRYLNEWTKILYDAQMHDDCVRVLDYAISINADITDIYILRARLYVSFNETDKINSLIDIAKTLNTIKKDIIINKLNSIMVENVMS